MIPAIWTGIYATYPLPETLRDLHQEGWTAFEISTEHLVALKRDPARDRQIVRTMRVVADLRLAMPQAHALLGADVAQPEARKRRTDIRRLAAHLRLAARLGCRTVVMHPGGRNGFTTRAEQARQRIRNVDAFRELGDLAGQLGLKIALENLMRFGSATPADMLDLLAAIGHPALGLCLDTSHANAVRLDVADMVREFAPFLLATHISDNDGSGDQHRVPGSGRIDWVAVMAAFRDSGYTGLFNLEIPGERHPLLQIQRLKLRHARAVADCLIGLAGPIVNEKKPKR
jgi:sugar phosphate isomerase/epimerase